MFINSEIKPFEKKVWLATPTMHDKELQYIHEAFDTNWVSTIGKNIDEVERLTTLECGVKYAVGLSCGTSALHLCFKLAAEKLYGKQIVSHGILEGKRVFCSDMTFSATLNPLIYEGGIPVFIDTEEDSWNMDPVSLEKAFEIYPDVKLVVCAELYGFPGRMDLIRDICHKHGALLIEDAAEAMGATLNGEKCGSFGDYAIVSFNGNKIITGSTGGCILLNDIEEANRARKISTQAREQAPWYQHVDLGYNYRMSNIIAGVIRGQYPYIKEHIERKKEIYDRYKEGLKNLPLSMNPITLNTEPNYWLSALIIDKEYMCAQERLDCTVTYKKEHGKSCPTEILDTISSINAEGRPIWKPMHMQPIFNSFDVIARGGSLRSSKGLKDVGADIFNRGCCLPTDIKMTADEQKNIIEVIKRCFD